MLFLKYYDKIMTQNVYLAILKLIFNIKNLNILLIRNVRFGKNYVKQILVIVDLIAIT